MDELVKIGAVGGWEYVEPNLRDENRLLERGGHKVWLAGSIRVSPPQVRLALADRVEKSDLDR